MEYYKEKNVLIRNMESGDAQALHKHFSLPEGHKGASIYETV